jgi:hypothetical protein
VFDLGDQVTGGISGAALAAPGVGNGVAQAPVAGAGGGKVGAIAGGGSSGLIGAKSASAANDGAGQQQFRYSGGAHDGVTMVPNPNLPIEGNYGPNGEFGHYRIMTPGGPAVFVPGPISDVVEPSGGQYVLEVGQELALGAWDTLSGVGTTLWDTALSVGSRATLDPLDEHQDYVRAADARMAERWHNFTFENTLGPIAQAIDAAFLRDDLRPMARVVGGGVVGGGLGRTLPPLGRRMASAMSPIGNGIPINGATRTVPLGFDSPEQFHAAAADLQAALRRSGIDDAVVGVRGSSVTGSAHHTGDPFGPTSDIDFFAQSAQATEGLRGSRSIPGFVHSDRIHSRYPELLDWSNRWTAASGRKVTVGVFVPGMLPVHPAIIVR